MLSRCLCTCTSLNAHVQVYEVFMMFKFLINFGIGEIEFDQILVSLVHMCIVI